MFFTDKFKKQSFLVYGLGITGRSVINFFKENKIKSYQVWDDNIKNLYKKKRPSNLKEVLGKVNYIVLSPGININKSKHKNQLIKYKNKIITDIDLLFLSKKNFTSIVVTGTNGKSTTCKIIYHVLKKNKFISQIGGNIGTPILSLKIKKNSFLIIEASSFQLTYSKFIKPDYALLLNITNDHLDWHGNKLNYINSKFKIFKLQKKTNYALLNDKFKKEFKKRNFKSKLIVPRFKNYKKFKSKIFNSYLKSNINDENMTHVFALSKLLRIKEKNFIKSVNTFKGLPHRYEIFLKKNNSVFINDSKATSFESSKFALKNSCNTFWIVGGLPKKNDKIILNNLKKNIIKSYIIGKNINFFKNQIKHKIKYFVAKDLKNSLIQISKDIKNFKYDNNTILLSPAAASYDQFINFEKRGEEFKKLSKHYANKYF